MSVAVAYPAVAKAPAGLIRPLVTILVSVFVLAGLGFYAPSFFKLNNLVNTLVQASTLTVLAIGMPTVMIGGGIDLSLPFNAALSAVLGAMYMRATGDALVGPLIMIAAATAIDALNGIAVGYLRMIPFVVTLAMMTVTNGAAVWLAGSISIADIPELRSRRLGRVPDGQHGLRTLALCGRHQSQGGPGGANSGGKGGCGQLHDCRFHGGHRRDHADRAAGFGIVQSGKPLHGARREQGLREEAA
jgi:hypothetical protein